LRAADYRQVANLQPTFAKIAALGVFEKFGPIPSKEVVASIQRNAGYRDLAQKFAV